MFVETLSNAFTSGDLSEIETVKLSMMYENFSVSSDDHKNFLQSEPTIQSANPNYALQEPYFWPNDIYNILNSREFEGYKCNSDPSRLHSIALPRKFNGLDVSILEAMRTISNPFDRVTLFKYYWEQLHKTAEKLWWIGEHTTPLSDDNGAEVVAELGLYHWRTLNAGEYIVHLIFDCTEKFKPTWIDAGLAFFFDAAEDAPSHGWTRSLLTGEKGIKEWIATSGKIDLIDVEVLKLQTSIQLDQLSTEYIEIQRNRINQKREGRVMVNAHTPTSPEAIISDPQNLKKYIYDRLIGDTNSAPPALVRPDDENVSDYLLARYRDQDRSIAWKETFYESLKDAFQVFVETNEVNGLTNISILCLRLDPPANKAEWEDLLLTPEALFNIDNKALISSHANVLTLASHWKLKNEEYWKNIYDQLLQELESNSDCVALLPAVIYGLSSFRPLNKDELVNFFERLTYVDNVNEREPIQNMLVSQWQISKEKGTVPLNNWYQSLNTALNEWIMDLYPADNAQFRQEMIQAFELLAKLPWDIQAEDTDLVVQIKQRDLENKIRSIKQTESIDTPNQEIHQFTFMGGQ